MLRTQVAMVAALAAILCAMNTGQAQGLELGEKFEGELKGEKKEYRGSPDKKGLRAVWTQELPITLKAGQRISISVSVTGTKRQVALALVNPAGKTIATTVKYQAKKEWGGKTAQLEFEEVSASGKFSIVVISDEPGPFTLRTTGSSTKELDEQALKKRKGELEEELAEINKKLKALEEKQSR